MASRQLEKPPPYFSDLDINELPSVPRDDFRFKDATPTGRIASSASPPLSVASVASHTSRQSHIFDTILSPTTKQEFPKDVVLNVTTKLPNVPAQSPGEQHNGNSMVLDAAPQRRDTALSAEDLIVAEALTDLRSFGSPPPVGSPAIQKRAAGASPTLASGSQEPEPLLSLLKTSHPWLSGTIDHASSAYESTKSYSPRFVQHGVNFVERNLSSPIASTVETVGRRTGVEGRIRHYLDSRRPSDLERMDPKVFGDPGSKRRRVITADEAMDIDDGLPQERQRGTSARSSIESLPAYDEARSPPYQEDMALSQGEGGATEQQRAVSRSWSTQLMISTSGLGAALNESSLRSLKYCLGILRNAIKHVKNLVIALKKVLEEYEQSSKTGHRNLDPEKGAIDSDMMDVDSAESSEASALAEKIKKLNEEIWNTLKTVVNTVSRYTGGALPSDRSAYVRRQLLSVPHRWRKAVSESVPINESQPAEDTISSAQRMLAFAREGLEMMGNVGGTVESTIVSAERWLDSMGRRREGQASGSALDSKDEVRQPAPLPASKEGA